MTNIIISLFSLITLLSTTVAYLWKQTWDLQRRLSEVEIKEIECRTRLGFYKEKIEELELKIKLWE